MTIPCYWQQIDGDPCTFIANHIIIYTCWNEHIYELAVCNTHMAQWQNEFHHEWLVCVNCESEIVEWDRVDVKNITVKYVMRKT
jgi:hypothetical protein